MRWFNTRQFCRLAAILVLPAALAGCKCDDIPPGAIPRQAGTYACQWQTAQIARAQQDHFVIYEYEWYLGGKELGPFGQNHIAQIAEEIEHTPLKVVVEPHFNSQRNAPDESLNQARLQAIVNQLIAKGLNDAQDRVVLGQPQAEGMYGEEAVHVGTQRLEGSQSTNGGSASPTGGSFGGIGSSSPSSGGFGGSGAGIGGL